MTLLSLPCSPRTFPPAPVFLLGHDVQTVFSRFLGGYDFIVDCRGKVIRLCIRDDSRALDTTYALLNFIGSFGLVRSDHMAVYVYKRRHYEFPYFSLTFEFHTFPFS